MPVPTGNFQGGIKKYVPFRSAKKAPSYTPKPGESAAKQQLFQLKQWPSFKSKAKKQDVRYGSK